MLKSTSFTLFVGIDVSKNTLDICCLLTNQQNTDYYKVSNDIDGLSDLEHILLSYPIAIEQIIICCEHTGRYSEPLMDWALENQFNLAVEHTTVTNKVTPSHHHKNDSYDAHALAEYACRYADKLTIYRPGPDHTTVKQVERLHKEQQFLIKERAKFKAKRTEARFHQADMEDLTTIWNDIITTLTAKIEALDEHMDALIKDSDHLSFYDRILRSVPGIGQENARFWICKYAGFRQLNPRKIASRFGWAPLDNQSGTVEKPRRSSGHGNSDARRLMHLAARSVSYHNRYFSRYYQRKLSEGKPSLLVFNNIINKLVRIICALWNKKELYDPTHHEKLAKQFASSA